MGSCGHSGHRMGMGMPSKITHGSHGPALRMGHAIGVYLPIGKTAFASQYVPFKLQRHSQYTKVDYHHLPKFAHLEWADLMAFCDRSFVLGRPSLSHSHSNSGLVMDRVGLLIQIPHGSNTGLLSGYFLDLPDIFP